MFEGHNQAIHDLLSARRLVEPTALVAALENDLATGKSLARALVDSGAIDLGRLLQAVAGHLGCDWQDPLPDELPHSVTSQVKPDLARTRGVIPLTAAGRALRVAALNPFDPHLIDDLSFLLGREIRLTVADPSKVDSLIRRYYGEEEARDQAQPEPTGRPADGSALTPADLEKLAGQPPIIRFVNLVLAQAVREGASDIHFEPFETGFRIRSRVDGTLRDLPPPPSSLALPVTSRLKVLANLNIAERRLPQDGRIRLTLAGRTVDLRVSTLPTQFGESVVLRVLDQSALRLDMGQLGLPSAIHESVLNVIRRPHGIFIVTGPTGSGKTTTLYSCLKELNTTDAKLLSVEDPVEYEIDGVMQVPVNLSAGLSFARTLRTFLRQDPDIVMVGEVRDAETARIAIQASLTGHLVLTTLHTNDTASAVTRLMDMGIEPFLLASTVEAVLAQRLLRRVCAKCRAAYEPSAALLHQLGMAPDQTAGRLFHRGAGCSDCQQSGYRGRIGIFEYLPMSETLRDLIMQGATLVELRQRAAAEGLVTLRDAGLAAAFAGDTTVEEIMKFT
ncbi:MAG TPA: GspE/PulE family protein [Lacunisphaera sp.]